LATAEALFARKALHWMVREGISIYSGRTPVSKSQPNPAAGNGAKGRRRPLKGRHEKGK